MKRALRQLLFIGVLGVLAYVVYKWARHKQLLPAWLTTAGNPNQVPTVSGSAAPPGVSSPPVAGPSITPGAVIINDTVQVPGSTVA